MSVNYIHNQNDTTCIYNFLQYTLEIEGVSCNLPGGALSFCADKHEKGHHLKKSC